MLLNSQTSRTATSPSHFTNTRSCIVPTASHQTENFQYLNPYVNPSRNHIISNSTLLNSQTQQNTDPTRYFFSIITSSIIFHHNVKSQDLYPCVSVDITDFPKLALIHLETNTAYPYFICPSQRSLTRNIHSTNILRTRPTRNTTTNQLSELCRDILASHLYLILNHLPVPISLLGMPVCIPYPTTSRDLLDSGGDGNR